MPPISEPVPPPLAEDWQALKDAIKRFERAWVASHRPEIKDHLPSSIRLRQRVLIELVHIDLELRLKAGEPARIEEYLVQFPELNDDHAVVMELIAAEHVFRRRSEPGLTTDEYLKRFPQLRAEPPEQLTRLMNDDWG